MVSKLQLIYSSLQRSSGPEQIFGPVSGSKELNKKYNKLVCEVITEDKGQNEEARDALTTKTLALINKAYKSAELKLKKKTYDNHNTESSVSIVANGVSLILKEKVGEGTSSKWYLVQKDKQKKKFLAKIGSSAASNVFLENEQKVLNQILNGFTVKLAAMATIPKLVATSEIVNSSGEKRAISIFENMEGFISLENVMKHFPEGMPARHVSWIWKRVMASLVVAHQVRLVHGAITPDHIFINPETHAGILMGWGDAATQGNPVLSFNSSWKSFYPPEVFAHTTLFSTDIYMSAMCMLRALAGEKAGKEDFLKNTPPSISAMIESCLGKPATRPNDAHDLHARFEKVLEKVYGKAKFVKFEIPNN